MMIQYSTQCIEQDDIDVVAEAMKQEWLTGGPTVVEFESRFAEYVGAKYAVAMSSCTAALHAACYVIGIHEGDEVITTPNTMASSANAAWYCGGRPVFADIEKDTYNIDPVEIEKKITSRTKAIVAVHYSGQPCKMDAIHAIAKKHNLIVIEDAAHAAGAEYKGQKIGGLSDMTAFSFHPVKTMTTCEGGMVTTNDEALYEQLKLFRVYGIVRTPEMMEKEGPWFSEQIFLGYNYRLTDVQCALGMNQLKKLDRFIARRREIARRYDEELADLPNVVLPKQDKEGKSSYHLYSILVDADKRRDLYMRFREAGIGVGVQYYPVYKHRFYQENGYRDVYCPISEEFYTRELTLPAHPKVSDADLNYIIDTARKLLQ